MSFKVAKHSCQVAANIAVFPLIEIEHQGDRLTGCLECNLWQGDKSAFIVELEVEDWEELG